MTDWIDFLVYALFIGSLWFVQPVMQHRLAIPFLKDRNAEWVAAHPDAVRAVETSRWRIWLSWALGGISLAVLAAFQLGIWQVPAPPPGAPPLIRWMVLWNLAMASMLVALVVGGTIGLVGQFLLKRHIPIAPRRQASLERRSLDDYVPRAVQYAVYVLVLGNIAAWFTAAALGAYSSPIFWPRVVTILVLSGFFFFVARAMVSRRANVMDRVFGPAYRRWEVRWSFSTQLLTPLVGALRLYEEVNDTFLFDMSRAIQLFLALYISYAILRIALLPIDPAAKAPAPLGQTVPQS